MGAGLSMSRSSDTTLMVRFAGEVDPSLKSSASTVERDLDQTGARVEGTSGKHKSAMMGLAAGLGSAAGTMIGAGLTKAVDLVTDSFSQAISGAGALQQSIGAIDTVFKGGASQMHAWAQTAGTDVGLTKNEFNELGTLIGTQLKNGGTAMEQLAPKTNDLIKLGADLSSMFGGTSREAVEALSSALKGERDPIEKYGVSLTQAKIDAEAAALGFKKVGGSLSDEATQAATLSLIMKQTADAHGNFAKESNTLEGQQQRLSAGWQNFTVSIATMALPALTGMLTGLNDTMPVVEGFGKGLQGILDILINGDFNGELVDAFGWEEDSDIVGFLFDVRDGIVQIADVMSGAGAILFEGDFQGGLLGLEADDPIVGFLFLVREGVIAAGDALSDLWAGVTMSEDVRAELGDSLGGLVAVGVAFQVGLQDLGAAFAGWFAVVQPIAMEVFALLVSKWAEMQPAVGSTFESIMGIVTNVMGVITVIVQVATGILSGIWERWGPAVLGIIGGVWTAVTGIFSGAYKILEGITTVFSGFMTGDTDKMMQGVRQIFEGAFTGLKGIFSGAVEALGGIWQGIKNTFAGPVNWVIDNVLNPLLGKIREVAGFFGLKLELPKLPRVGGFADGGIMPGYTPGRDVHKFFSPTGGLLELSGGEPVLRPEAGVVLGSSWVHGINAAARAGGTSGVEAFLQQHAGGGFVSVPAAARFQTGGIIPNATQGFRGYDPGFLSALKAWAAATGRDFTMTGNGGTRARADQERAYALYVSGRGPLAARPGTSAHERGLAIDVSPHPNSREVALMREFGLGLTVAGEPWHIGSLRGGSGGGGFDPLGMLKAKIGDLLKVSGAGVLGDILNAVPGKLIDGVGSWISSQIASLFGGAPSGSDAASGGVQAIVRDAAAKRGWGQGSQWDALSWIIGKESSWNPRAQNPTSTAYGLFQFLNGTWAGTGIGKTSDPALQAEAGMRYIASRYGTPLGAQGFWQRNGWYDNGGWLMPGQTLATNETGRPEAVLTAGQWDAIRSAVTGQDLSAVVELLRELIDLVREAPLGHLSITATDPGEMQVLKEFAELVRRRRRVEVA